MGQSEAMRRRRAEIQWRTDCDRADRQRRELDSMRATIVDRTLGELERLVAETDATIATCRVRMGD